MHDAVSPGPPHRGQHHQGYPYPPQVHPHQAPPVRQTPQQAGAHHAEEGRYHQGYPPPGCPHQAPVHQSPQQAEAHRAEERRAAAAAQTEAYLSATELQARGRAAPLVVDAMGERPLQNRDDALWVMRTLEEEAASPAGPSARTPDALDEASRILHRAQDTAKRARDDTVEADLRGHQRPRLATRVEAEANGARAAEACYSPAMGRALSAVLAWDAARRALTQQVAEALRERTSAAREAMVGAWAWARQVPPAEHPVPSPPPSRDPRSGECPPAPPRAQPAPVEAPPGPGEAQQPPPRG